MNTATALRTVFAGLVTYATLTACTAGIEAASVPNARADAPPAAPPSVVSGSRIKGAYVTSADGLKSYYSDRWYDALLKLDCTLMVASDGVARCLPLHADWDQHWYADASCTEHITGVQRGFGGQTHTMASVAPDRVTVYQILNMRPVNTIYVKTDVGCYEDAPLFAHYAGLDFYNLSSEVMPGNFAELQTAHD